MSGFQVSRVSDIRSGKGNIRRKKGIELCPFLLYRKIGQKENITRMGTIADDKPCTSYVSVRTL